MNWRPWLSALACFAFLVLAYAQAAHSEEAAHQDVLAALENVSGGWHP